MQVNICLVLLRECKIRELSVGACDAVGGAFRPECRKGPVSVRRVGTVKSRSEV